MIKLQELKWPLKKQNIRKKTCAERSKNKIKTENDWIQKNNYKKTREKNVIDSHFQERTTSNTYTYTQSKKNQHDIFYE